MKQKELKNMINLGQAINLDELTTEQLGELIKRPYSRLACSTGTYGVNGLLVQDELTGQLYAVIGRSVNLFIFL